ncbi:hypothetical protein BKD09_07460 [Bradyrhizobium japonicum]|uniref:Uncharacterized protein n=1 Tax=Bradyrhizobium japonicum TaxID=375 RepID=A0A1L3F4C4_BRAJP|nr:hypothetical protein BKD09_07460 [Bradyrhizobium japonicum]
MALDVGSMEITFITDLETLYQAHNFTKSPPQFAEPVLSPVEDGDGQGGPSEHHIFRQNLLKIAFQRDEFVFSQRTPNKRNDARPRLRIDGLPGARPSAR